MENLFANILKSINHCDLTNTDSIVKMALEVQEKCIYLIESSPKLNMSERSLLQELCNKLWQISEQANLKTLTDLKLQGN
jgi:hypothetical protein